MGFKKFFIMENIKNVLMGIKNENYPVPKNVIEYKNSNIPTIKYYTQTVRKNGRKDIECLGEFIDNSVDALLNTDLNDFINTNNKKISVRFNLQEVNGALNDDSYLLVSDNGTGFGTIDNLQEALRLGSDLKNRDDNNLGFYGIGLNYSAFKLGRLFIVITKTNEGIQTGILDLDIAKKLNSWEFRKIRNANVDEIQLLNEMDASSIIIVSKLDQLSTVKDGTFKMKIMKYIGETFRYFISNKSNDNKITFIVNNELVKIIDPMCRDLKDRLLLNRNDEENNYSFSFNGIKIRIKYYFIPPIKSTDGSPLRTSNMKNQGLYVMRNNRQIQRAEFFKILSKHNSYNYFRGELFYDSINDDVMGTANDKSSIDPPDALIGKLTTDFAKYLDRTESIYKDKYKKKKKPTIDTIDKLATERINNNPLTPVSDNISSTKKNIRKKIGRPRKTEKKIELDLISKGERGKIFYEEPIGRRTWKISLNIDHPVFAIYKTLNTQGQSLYYNQLYVLVISSHTTLYTTTNISEQERIKLINKFFQVYSDNLGEIIIAQTT